MGAATDEHETQFRRPGPVGQARLRLSRTGAGRQPSRLYKEKARDWRRRNRLLVLSVSLMPLAFMALFYVVFHPRSTSFLTGFGCGASAAMFFGIRELGLPDRIDNWRVGAEGERRTARRLRRLERSGWVVHHSVMTGRGDWDHIVIGPRGIFLLDSKSRRGQIRVEDGALVVRHGDEGRRSRPEPMANSAVARARELERAIRGGVARKMSVNYTPCVRPAIVIWGEFPQARVESEGVDFVSGDDVVLWLESGSTAVPVPVWLERAVVDAVAEIVDGDGMPKDETRRSVR